MNIFSLSEAEHKTNNIVYNSPHSGELFPSGFLKTVAIDKETLLASGDSFVHRLFDDAPHHGSTLISNLYSRSFMDTNREALELDPVMFSGEITENLQSKSAKVMMGFGSIAKYAYTRKKIYKNRIPFHAAIKRLDDYYFPIHTQLNRLLAADFKKFGYSLLVDCHSMPSYEFLGQQPGTTVQSDIVIGDRFGTSCHPAITDYLTLYFRKHNFNVTCNIPFAGGYNTIHYGTPAKHQHAVQIEIKKSLYMNEKTRTPNNNFERIKTIMATLSRQLNDDIAKLIS